MSTQTQEYYAALVDRNSEYEGVFFFAVKSTGIFCRPTCPARKPRLENCVFFESIESCLLAGYRPCKRCRPLNAPGAASELISNLVRQVEQAPAHRWNDQDVRDLGYDPSTVRRQFKSRFGVTFVAYARARRLGIALQSIRGGQKVIDAQLDAAYDSGSGFRDAFAKILGQSPVNAMDQTILHAEWIDTPLGPMVTIADDASIHLLEFCDRRGLEREIEQLRIRLRAAILPGSTEPIESLRSELGEYFRGKLQHFATPLSIHGSPFQRSVMQQLQEVPYGTTVSYQTLAERCGKPGAVRAVASANGRNQIAIVIPCHRVIGSDGKLRGYAGGLARKQWLIEHEAGWMQRDAVIANGSAS